jgi:Tfp pilus assembly protein PilN
MRPRNLNTLLLITHDRLVRADLRPGRTAGVADLHEERRPAADDLPSLVEAALRLSRARPGNVWILSSELWTQVLSLPAESLAGLKPEEVSRALGFEAEPFSGINALEAAAAQVLLPEEGPQRAFWLTEISAIQLQQIDEIVQQSGGRLVGMSHPGGLPRPLCLPPAEQKTWQRVELWPGAILCIEGGTGRRSTVAVRNSDPRPGRWEADVEQWRTSRPTVLATESFHGASGVALDEMPVENRLSLEDAAGTEKFLTAWADALADGSLAVPRVTLPKPPMSASRRRAITIAAALAALAVCITAQLLLNAHLNRRIAETARLRKPAEQLAQLKSESEKLRKQRGELSDACKKLQDDLDHYQQVGRAQQKRLAKLLAVLARRAPEQMVIRKIDGNQDELTLHGLCLDLQSPDALAGGLAKDLAEALGPLGWQVQMPSKHSQDMLAAGGPWEFEIRIQEPEAPQPQPSSATLPPSPQPPSQGPGQKP